MTESAITEYMKMIGAKGGLTTGKTKRRGNKAYYQALAIKAAAARKKKAKNKP